MGADGIAISANGSRLYYCPLGSRKFYSVDTDALIDRSLEDQKVIDTIIYEGKIEEEHRMAWKQMPQAISIRQITNTMQYYVVTLIIENGKQ